MILKNIKLALRYAIKFKTYSFINVGGLALGLASSIAILHFVSEEFSYDTFHYKPENVYRLNTLTKLPTGDIQTHAAGTPILAPILMADLPEVEVATRLRHADDVLIEVGEHKFYETKVFFADSNFFKVLTFPLAQGDASTALSEVNSAVITTEFAGKYFGSDDPMGKTLEVDNILVKITGVTLPTDKSHFQFDVLISFETFTVPPGIPGLKLTSWGWTSFPTYVRLREGSKASDVMAKFPAFIAKYRSPEDAKKINYQLQPIKDVYLHSRNILERDGISTKGDYAYTTGLLAIAVLILGIACFNFANLSTALSIYRVKETGIRRTLGSSPTGIFSRFILESILTTTISLLLGIIILQLGVTKLENLLGTTLSLDAMNQMKWLPFYFGLIIVIGCFGGLYPAFFLSRLNPQLALKGKNILNLGSRKFPVRKAIIVFQFFITAALIATSLTIKKQMDFLLSKDLGYEKEGIIALRIPGDELHKLYASLRNKMSQNPMVLGVAASRDLFDGQQGVASAQEIGSDEELRINLFRMTPNFIETMGLKMESGRTFSEDFNDSSSFILNETAVKMFGWDKADVIGKKLSCINQTGEVIGVVKDFNFSSLHTTIAPLIMFTPASQLELLYVRVAPGDLRQTISSLESDWKVLAPHLPFDYVMLDEHVDQMYRQDKRFSQLAYVFCGLSVVLACLGLYGIMSFMAEARTKEIGIRKVLGASVSKIAALLSGQFMVWVLVAALIALPASYYLLNRWLADFAYRIDVSFEILLLSVFASLVIAGITVASKSIRAAMANPIDSLRSE